jgi:hypothetical protein
MRSHLEFRSGTLRDAAAPDGGEAVAQLLAKALPGHGFTVERVFAEDWGRCVAIANRDFPLWIGCGGYAEYSDGMLCFIEPSRPVIRKWLRRIDVSARVEALADAMERILADSGRARDLRWWSPEEVAAGG